MTCREAAKRLGVHENTIRNWRKQGIITGALRLPSGIHRYSREEIDRMRREMFQSFAPATTIDEACRGRPNVRPGEVEGG